MGRKAKKRSHGATRVVEPALRKRRTSYSDVISSSWAREASALEDEAASERQARVSATNLRNCVNQTIHYARTTGNRKEAESIDRDRAAFQNAVEGPLTLICGSCGTLNSPHSCRWRDLNYDDAYFAPLVKSSAPGAPQGIYEVAIDLSTNSANPRVAVCDRCDASLRKSQVPKFSLASGFSISAIPPQLAVLNDVESRMIGLGVSFTSCYKIRGSGQDCTKGHAVSYWNDACEIASSLPRPLEKCGVIRLHTRGTDGLGNVFTVRPNLIREALVWLLANNPLYKNVRVSEDVLAALHRGESETPTLTVDEDDEMTTRENINDALAETDDAEESFELKTGGSEVTESEEILSAIRRKSGLSQEAVVDRPSEMMNEYTAKMLMQSCFPVLFPDGKGGYNSTSFERRYHTYDLADYCAHLMRWHDRRFVIHPNFKFFCLNVIQRRQVDGLTRRLADRTQEHSKERQDSCDAQNNADARAKSLLKELKPYFRTVRGSGLYWSEIRDELMGLIGNRVLDNPYPTYFFTLSAADTVWPDFFRACDPSLTWEQAERLPPSTRRRLLNQNPDVASRHFYRRFKAFFDHVLQGESQPLGKIVDYFWRVEFQRRGSPHIHGLLWIENAPDVLKLCESEEGRAALASFVDKGISTRSFTQPLPCECAVCTEQAHDPDVDVLARRPPSSKDTQATLCDLQRIVSRVQQHRCFPGSSCRVKNGQCRFSFPKRLQQSTVISVDQGNDGCVKIEVECERDDPYTNGFSPKLLQIWRANMDIKLVGNAYGAAEYTAAYVSKSEPDTVKFRNAISRALEKCQDSSHLSALRRVANASISTREVSAQEALWILQRSLPMYGKSRSVIKVKTSRHHLRYYRVDMETCLHEMETSSIDADSSNLPRMEAMESAYAARPTDETFNNMNYHYFCEHYEPCDKGPSPSQRLQRWPRMDGHGFIKAKQKPQAVVKSPKLRVDHTNPDYCFSQIFLTVPWRKLEELPKDDEACIEQFVAISNSDHITQEAERQRQIDLQREEGVPCVVGSLEESPWTFAQGPDATNDTVSFDALASDATAPPSQRVYTDAEYERAKTFITLVVKPFVDNHAQRQSSKGDVQSPSYEYPIGTVSSNMTEEQWIPFALCMKQSRARRAKFSVNSECKPLHMILNGEGGTGKSWLIKHIVKDVHKVWEELGTSVRHSKRVLLMAHYGTAAFNIKGTTICSGLGFGSNTGGFNQPYKSLQDTKSGLKTLRNLQDKYQDVQLVIIDEYSVISCGMLHWIDQRMREVWPSCTHVPFGGRDIILAGDMGQLPSVSPASLVTPLEELSSAIQAKGRRLWTAITTVCTLRSQQRGLLDSEWYDGLARLRNMDETDDDMTLFNSRHVRHDDQAAWVQNATHVAYRNVDVDAANAKCLQACPNPVHHLPSTHTVTANERGADVCQPLDSQTIEKALGCAQEPNANRDRVIPPAVDLAIGVPITLTNNLAQTAGLCNGTKAVVHDFISNKSTPVPIVLVEIKDKYIGPSFIPELPNIVPVPPQTISWLSQSKQIRTTRTGLPLRLAYAMTIHKIQGLTCSKLVFDPVAIPSSTFSYVALSRVRHREDVLLTRSLELIKSKVQGKTKEVRHKEWQRMETLETAVRECSKTVISEMQALACQENNLTK